MKKAVVLVSGGMDSAVVLALAREQGFECHALSVSYGQRHTSELEAAARVAAIARRAEGRNGEGTRATYAAPGAMPSVRRQSASVSAPSRSVSRRFSR